MKCDKKEPVKVLGINCGIGSNSLKIKQELKERVGNSEVHLTNISIEKSVMQDLAGISDDVEFLRDYREYKCDENK